ncbi:MAG: efflux RND transporter periplasmic adaptor subunit [Caulobacterales bacterium]
MNAPVTPIIPPTSAPPPIAAGWWDRQIARFRAAIAGSADACARSLADIAKRVAASPIEPPSPANAVRLDLVGPVQPAVTPKAGGETDLAALLGEPAAKAWYRRREVWIGALALLAAAGGLWWWLAVRAADATPVFSTQAAVRGPVTLTVSANGTIQPTRTISIGSELSGTVLAVNVDVNDRVKRGQVLVVLDTAKLRDQVLRAKAAVATATANETLADATVRETRANLARLDAVAKLSAGRTPSRAELDAGRAALARAAAAAASARAGVLDARAGLSTDQINLSKASITAPADGVVLTRSVDPGNAVAASLQAVTLFTLAEDLSKLRLWVYVDEADVGAVKVSQAATFTVSAFPARKYPAKITRVGFGSTITDNVVTYLTYLDVDNSDLSLRPGMTATASIIAAARRDVLLVPNTALRFTPSATKAAKPAAGGVFSSLAPRMPSGNRRRAASSGESTAAARQVFVLRDGAPVAVAVTPGISDGRVTEIIGGDLQAGMLVITDQRTGKSAAAAT